MVVDPGVYDLHPAHPVVLNGVTVAWAISAEWAAWIRRNTRVGPAAAVYPPVPDRELGDPRV